MRFISTPLVFSNEISNKRIQDFCSKCCVTNDHEFNPNEIIRDLTIYSWSYPEKFENKNSFFEDSCGDIRVHNYQFIQCYSIYSSGGGIHVEQYCEVEISNCIFYKCHSLSHGGAIAVADQIIVINSYYINDPAHEKTIS